MTICSRNAFWYPSSGRGAQDRDLNDRGSMMGLRFESLNDLYREQQSVGVDGLDVAHEGWYRGARWRPTVCGTSAL